jgi:arginine decarboxylase
VLGPNVLNTNTTNQAQDFESILTDDDQLSPTVKKLVDIYKSIDRHSVREDYHDTIQPSSGGQLSTSAT